MDTTIGVNSSMENQEPVIVFDTTSGISKEEQEEILSSIDVLTMQNRMQPSQDALKVKAKKGGSLFPIIVNSMGFLILAGGMVLLFMLHQHNTLQFQKGSAYLGLTERRLIQEIRKENASQLNLKELEIADIKAKLAEIDIELHNMQMAMEERIHQKEEELRQQINREMEEERTRLMAEHISENAVAEQMQLFEAQKNMWLNTELANFRKQLEEERLVAEGRLQSLKEEYQTLLARLQAEYIQTVEAARIREADLHAQLQESAGRFNTLHEQNLQELSAVQQELSQLTDEWERSSLIEAQMSGFYTTVNNQIRAGQQEAAVDTLRAMQEFLNTPAFQHLRFMQSRKEFYLASINTFMEIIEADMNQVQIPQPAPIVETSSENTESAVEYKTIIAELTEQNAALQQTIAAFNSQPQPLPQRETTTDYETAINALKAQNASLEQTLKTRDTTINTLRTQNTNLQQTVSARDTTITDLRTQNTGLQQNASTKDTTINTLRTQNASLQQTVGAHEITIREFRTQNTTLQQTLATQDNALNEAKTQTTALQQSVNTLRTQNTSLQQTVSARDSTITDLRTQNTSLQQTVSTRESTINDLRTQNTSLQQTVSARDSTITDLRTQNTNLSQNVEQLRQTNEAVRKLLNNE